MDASAPVAAVAQTATSLAGPTTFDVVYPFTILLVLALSIPAALLGINFVLARLAIGNRNNSPGKLTQVESGIANNIGTAEEKFSIKFYLVAMLFLAFDMMFRPVQPDELQGPTA